MKLTERHKKVLSFIQHDSTMSDLDCGRGCGMSAHAVRRVRSYLQMKGILLPSIFVDPFRIGLQDFVIYFSFASSDRTGRDKLLRLLANDERVSWVFEVGGDFDYGVAARVSHAAEFSDLMSALCCKTNGTIVNKRVAMEISFTRFGRKSFASRTHWPKPLECTGREAKVDIDQLDLAILGALRQGAFASWTALARQLRQPLSTVSYRISRLRSCGIILGLPYRINSEILGLHGFRVLVGASEKLGKVGKDSQIYRFAAEHPHVYGIIETLGSWDWELGVEVLEPRQAASVVRDLHQALGSQIAFVHTIPVFQTHKASYQLIPEAPPNN